MAGDPAAGLRNTGLPLEFLEFAVSPWSMVWVSTGVDVDWIGFRRAIPDSVHRFVDWSG